MAKYDDFQNVHSAVGLSGGAAAATTTSPSLDTKGMEQATVILQVGIITSPGTLDVKIEDSADDSAWADLTGAVFAQQVDANDGALLLGKIKCNRDSGTPVRRYLRISATTAAGDAEFGCLLIGSNLSGHIPYVTNALPAPVYDIGSP